MFQTPRSGQCGARLQLRSSRIDVSAETTLARSPFSLVPFTEPANTAPNDDAPANVLVLLHGLGDKHESFTNLGKQMNLPETVCISVRGQNNLLDLGGFHWGDDIIFDSTSGGLDADSGFKQSTEMLVKLVNEGLIEKCGFKAREVMFFGFGQGGIAALQTAGVYLYILYAKRTQLTRPQYACMSRLTRTRHVNSAASSVSALGFRVKLQPLWIRSAKRQSSSAPAQTNLQ